MVDEGQEWLIEVGDVQKSDRLVDLRKLVHGPDFHHLFSRTDTAGHRDEGVGEFGHPFLAVAQGRDDLASLQIGMQMPPLTQLFGDHAVRRATGIDQRIGDNAIKPFVVPP
jgi:hypothetical protein